MRSLLLHNFLVSKLKPFFFHTTCKHQRQLCRTIKSTYSCFSDRKDPTALAKSLSFSEESRSLVLGAQVHGCIIKSGFTNDVFVHNNLIKMYSKFGLLCDGIKVFDEMPQRNIVSWTLLISGAVQSGDLELGLETYFQMRRNGLVPNEFSLGSVLKLCASLEASEFGSCIHCLALKIGMEKNLYVVSSILSFYAKLGDIEAADNMFKSMDNADVGCWNAMIGGYTQCGHGFEAISIMSLMRHKGIRMDKYTFISALQGCSLAGDLNFGRQIHGLIIASELESIIPVMNAVMDMYFKTGETDAGMNVFNRMHDRDVVTWNTVLGSFSQYEDPKQVVSLFCDFMLSGMKPNHITFSVLFRQCGELLKLDLGLQFFCLALHFGFSFEPMIISSLIFMFSRCGAMEMACLVFDSIIFKNIINWNDLILGYNLNCCDMKGLKTFRNLLQFEFRADEYTFSNVLEICCRSENQKTSRVIHGAVLKSGFASHGYVCRSLIKCYVKFGLLDDSFKVFNGQEIRDLTSWGTMISTLVHEGYYYEAIRLLNPLTEVGQKPDEFILGSILNSCAGISACYQTRSVHSFVIKLGFEGDRYVISAILDAYAKCGDIRSARMAFDQPLDYNDVIIYNTMMMGYAHHGLFAEAMEIFNEMKLANIHPSQATFVSIISVCGHMGLVDQGCFLFKSMELEYGMKPSPDNYGCLVDMFSRNGYLEEAKQIIETMPYPAWPAILRSLLSGCRTYGNRELGEWAAEKLLQLVPKNDAAYALLFKVYSEDGSWEDAEKVRKGMTDIGLKKDAGQSCIEAW